MEKGLKLNVLNVAKRVILHLIVPQRIKRSYKELGVNSNLIKQITSLKKPLSELSDFDDNDMSFHIAYKILYKECLSLKKEHVKKNSYYE
ncbi:hypothetical protein AAG906_019645 [Vitis piasezkii]|uniref:Uncharacterized protein n=1 Tax=Vitis vinifera TaxID=29760 RepID=A0A438BSM8_VITVI|nr:hypothetical protein CK203_114113 [Vitis vinifera]